MTRKKTVKSPLQNPPLRNPAQSLLESKDNLITDKLLQYIWYPTFGICWAVYEWCRFFFDFGPQHVAATLFAVVTLAVSIPGINLVRKRLKDINKGIEGEKSVGQFLEQFRTLGYQVFHDIPGDIVKGEQFNIDHVLIGPGGIFTIETKYVSKPAKGRSVIENKGNSIRVNGHALSRDPLVQAKAQSRHLRKFLMQSTGRTFSVKPIVVFPGWFVQNKAPNSPVLVLNEKMIRYALDRSQVFLAEDDIRLAAYHLGRHILSVTRQAA